ncbi:hypothetical protein [Pseudomonas sp. BBP2017]|uniref:hypothetical protein n=1 Tax=Pseudomonas sp. BBP2017 TaxID=2109731 RepID=UPI000D120C75|nr:hypothetical protein [Pseudomonas sp. BBP2017]PSS49005.1 hypothetical protein C6382_19775 [Pseudomonas sp. BBP2017]
MLPISLDHQTRRIRQNLTLNSQDRPTVSEPIDAASFKHITGTLSIPEIADLSGHQLITALHAVHLDENQHKTYVNISENSFQIRGTQEPFSLHVDAGALTKNAKPELSFLLRHPTGRYVAGRVLRDVDLYALISDLQVE